MKVTVEISPVAFKYSFATIRGDFAISVQNNLVHGSDSADNAATEIALWFQPDELLNYPLADAAWVAGA